MNNSYSYNMSLNDNFNIYSKSIPEQYNKYNLNHNVFISDKYVPLISLLNNTILILKVLHYSLLIHC